MATVVRPRQLTNGGIIRIERIQEGTFGVVDYISGKPEVRFKGSEWLCYSFVVGLVSPLQLAEA